MAKKNTQAITITCRLTPNWCHEIELQFLLKLFTDAATGLAQYCFDQGKLTRIGYDMELYHWVATHYNFDGVKSLVLQVQQAVAAKYAGDKTRSVNTAIRQEENDRRKKYNKPLREAYQAAERITGPLTEDKKEKIRKQFPLELTKADKDAIENAYVCSAPPVFSAQTLPTGDETHGCRLSSDKKHISIYTAKDIPLAIPKGVELTELNGGNLTYRDGKWLLFLTVYKEKPPLLDTTECLGLDLGVNNLVYSSTGECFSGAEVRAVRERRYSQRKRLQKGERVIHHRGKPTARMRELQQQGVIFDNPRKATKLTKRHLKHKVKAIGARESRFSKDFNHKLSRKIVDKAVQTQQAIAMETLTGIREGMKRWRKDTTRKIHSWPFAQLQEFITYKAAIAGIPVIKVAARYTSQKCSNCGHVSADNRKIQEAFRCVKCGFELHADHNAAINIGRKGAEVLRRQKEKREARALTNSDFQPGCAEQPVGDGSSGATIRR